MLFSRHSYFGLGGKSYPAICCRSGDAGNRLDTPARTVDVEWWTILVGAASTCHWMPTPHDYTTILPPFDPIFLTKANLQRRGYCLICV